MVEPANEPLRALSELRSGLSAITLLAPAWNGSEPGTIAAALSETLITNLHADFAYVAISTGGDFYEACSTLGGLMDAVAAHHAGKLLDVGVSADGPYGAAVLLSGFVTDVIGPRANHSYVVVGSKRLGFPTDDERLLLGSAANQAAVAVQRAAAYGLTSASSSDAPHMEEAREANTTLLLAALAADRNSETSENARAQLQLLLEGLAEGVMVFGADGGVFFINSSARAITGLSGDTFDSCRDGGFLLERLDGVALDVDQWPISRAIRGEHFIDHEFAIVRDDGRHYVTFSANSVKGPQDEILLAIVTCRDVTDFRRLERVRHDDTALISHDLRNPLSIIMTAAHRLRREAATGDPIEDAEELGALINANALRMREMIEELVESAYLESADVALQNEPISMTPLVKGVVERLGEPQRISVAIIGKPAAVNGDRARIERIVDNLVGNAVKYSAAGSQIEVAVTYGPAEVAVSVRDHGEGIAAEELPHLFDRFYRVQRESVIKGSGLGLYIASLVARTHGGWIKVTSEVGIGSCFTFALPIAPITVAEG